MDASTDQITGFLISLSYTLPITFLYLIGIVLAIVFRKRAGAASILAVIGFLLLIVGSAIQIGYTVWLFFFYYSAPDPVSTMQTISTVQSIAHSTVAFIGTALLIFAIFANRKQTVPETK